MPRALIATLIVAALVIVANPRAQAQVSGSSPLCVPTLLGGGVECTGGSAARGSASGDPSGWQPPGATAPVVAAQGPTVLVAMAGRQDGKSCWTLELMPSTGLSPQQIRLLEVDTAITMASMPPCLTQPGRAAVVPPPTPAQLAADFWYSIRLPVPRPVSRPGYATAGKLVFLAAGDTNSPGPWRRATPFGMLSITAHGSYSVGWGDGSPMAGPFESPGGPYPSGSITHTYDRVGSVTITVVEAWTATWAIGALHGRLVTLHTTGTLRGFPVRQIQAVVTG